MRHRRPGSVPFRQLQARLCAERGQAPPPSLSERVVQRIIVGALATLIILSVGGLAALVTGV